MIKLSIFYFSIFLYLFSDLKKIKSDPEFKCISDGLFEDENNCEMYYECTWIGTAFAKQEHLKCANDLIYNPRKHRCDNIFEFESQFSKGVRTPEELLEFIRYRNCIGSKNIIGDGYTSPNFDKTSPPADYYPHIASNEKYSNEDKQVERMYSSEKTSVTQDLNSIDDQIRYNLPRKVDENNSKENFEVDNDNGSNKKTLILTNKPIETTSTQTTVTTKSNQSNHTDHFDSAFLMDDELIYFGRKLFLDSLNKTNSSGSDFNETIDQNDKETLKFKKEILNENETVKKSNFKGIFDIYKSLSRKSINDEKTLIKNSTFNNSHTDITLEILITNDSKQDHNKTNDNFQNKTFAFNETLNDKKMSEIHTKSHRKRRLLSMSDSDDLNISFQTDDDDASPTTLLEDEIDSNDELYHDKDQIVDKFTNKVMKKIGNKFDDSNDSKKIKTKNSRENLIDSIEENLSKNGLTSVSKEVLENAQTKKVILKKDYDNKPTTMQEIIKSSGYTTDSIKSDQTKSVILTQKRMSNDSKTIFTTPDFSSISFSSSLPSFRQTSFTTQKITTKFNSSRNSFQFKKPIKFLKMLPKINLTSTDEHKPIRFDKLDELLNLSNKILYKEKTTQEPTTQNVNITTNKLEMDENNESEMNQIEKNNFKRTTRNNEELISATFLTQAVNVQSTSAPTSFLDIILRNSTIPFSSHLSTKSHAQPTMQTYKINQTKKIPNQFASLRLNYDNDVSVTKIDEIERGGKFQRLKIAPADTLIECKENDFGLECSCSITLSPPKCKQLINSFLSSCRILGCKNNGKCINMAYKYPIPYVCSCPSDFMGTYCEIPRNNQQYEDDISSKEDNNWRFNMNTQQKQSSQSPSYKYQNNAQTAFLAAFTTTPSIEIFTTKVYKSPLKIERITTVPVRASTTTPNRKAELDLTTAYKEPLCNPNPCMNEAKCKIIRDTFECICLNSSFSGRYCENLRLTPISTTKTPQQNVEMFITTRIPMVKFDDSSRRLPNKFLTNQVKYEPFRTTPKAYFWQCPSNCFQNLGRGYCSLSNLGQPQCTCKLEWTGVDCSQRNYCVINRCSNNSTCTNFPEMKSYLCICPKGVSGRYCEFDMRSNQLPQNSLVFKAQSILVNNTQKVKSLMSLPAKNPCINQPCKNNGTCMMSFSHAKNKFSFVCKCREGFYGTLCEHKDILETYSSIKTSYLSTLTTSSYTTQDDLNTIRLTTTKKPLKLTINRSNISIQPKKKLLNITENPCKIDPDLCRKYPSGNESFICVKSFITQDYTLCLPTKIMNCKESNPCLNGGVCVEDNEIDEKSINKPTWKCVCSNEFTGRLCETEVCSPVHKLFSNHTMCLPDSPNLSSGGVSSSDIELILDMHNTLRRQVAPIASNMQQMYWDVRLQHLAQKRAHLCSVENTGILMRQQPGYGVVIGENLAAGYEKWSHVLTSWMSERKHFIYKSTSPTDNLQAGHYTQMIYSSASRIGCGYAECANSTYERYFVCYYGEMQTYYSRYEPYEDGKSCSSCENNCNKGLCDCKGAYCLNGGTLDLNTCTCTCPYSTFSGRYCENVICPKEDSPFCSQSLFEDKCWLYPVVRATCPYMCSLCSKNSNNSTIVTSTPKLFENQSFNFN